MMELQGLRKKYADSLALDGVDLRLPGNTTTVLIGPSGCGKSTLLRLVNGLITPDAGVVRIQNQILTRKNRQTLRQRMGYVIQHGGLFPHLSAADNATLMARHLRWPSAKIQKRLNELSELVRLPADALQRFPSELSGGQSQRVSLMRALMLDPEVLLMDEPLAALDPMIRAELQVDLRDIFQRLKKTVCWVTHDLAEAAYFSDRIVLMRDGGVVQVGSLSALQQQPKDEFVTRFVNAQRQLAGAP